MRFSESFCKVLIRSTSKEQKISKIKNSTDALHVFPTVRSDQNHLVSHHIGLFFTDDNDSIDWFN